MALEHYHQKRNFKHTPEPKGAKVKEHDHHNHFVVQMHAARHLHYDFRLEKNGVLLSWAVPKGPCLDPTVKRLAVHVEDHPLEYKDFEGIIPTGQYGSGTVMVWDQGEWNEVDDGKSLHKGALTFTLNGEKLKGKWKLIQIKNDPKNWLLIKAKDEQACPQDKYDITEEEPKSVISGRTLNEIKENAMSTWTSNKTKSRAYNLPKAIQKALTKRQLPSKIPPQLATLVDKPPSGDDWIHEMKFDGYRLLAVISKEVKLITRGQHNWTDKFEPLAKELKQLKLPETIIDGELVALDEKGLPNFQLLQNTIKNAINAKLVYYVFDVLYYQGYDLTTLPLLERKAILEKILPKNHPSIRYSDHIQGNGEKVFKKAAKLGFEGIVSKNIDSPYIHKRGKNWLKVKVNQRQEFVIGGYTEPSGDRAFFGALLLGVYDKNKKLQYCGRVGTGFTDASLKELHALLTKQASKKCPFAVQPAMNDLISWVKPTMMAEVEFKEWTSEGILRHASFKGVRQDKKPIEVTHEHANSLFQLTHPEKLLYPKDNITKQEISQYYLSIKDWILPYIINRPLSLLRCPGGIESACFYQKHLPAEHKNNAIQTIEVKENTKTENYIYITNLEGLMQLVQMGTLEIHPWGASISNIERPDYLTFDLDPAEDVPYKYVVKAAFEIKGELEKLELVSFLKTTGGKGLHIVIPIQPRYTWSDVNHFAKTFAKYLSMKYPDQYIDTMSKIKRKGKIFVDYLRNHRGATAIAAFSTRARRGATVSMPLSWEELTPKIHSDHFTVLNSVKHLNKLNVDPWKGFFSIKQKLPSIDESN